MDDQPGDTDLSGAWSDRHADGFQRAVWVCDAPVGARRVERAPVCVLQSAADASEDSFLGRQWAMGMRQAAGARAFFMAGERGD